jgi:hypothetical protein
MTIEKLKELHEYIKSHPYRLESDEKYLKDYKQLLYDISHEWYLTLKEYPKYSRAINMCHDFNGAISMMPEYANNIYHVEMCLGVIHNFIDTEKVPYYYTYYGGDNALKSLPKFRKHIFDSKENKYYISLTREQVEGAIKEIEDYYKRTKKDPWYEFGIYGKSEYDFLVEYMNKRININE